MICQTICLAQGLRCDGDVTVCQVTAEEANFLSASRAWMAEVLAKYNAPKVKDIDGASAADR